MQIRRLSERRLELQVENLWALLDQLSHELVELERALSEEGTPLQAPVRRGVSPVPLERQQRDADRQRARSAF